MLLDLHIILEILEQWSVVASCAREVRSAPTPKIPYMAILTEKYTQEKADITVVFGDYVDIKPFMDALRRHSEIFDTENIESGAPEQVKDKGIKVLIKIPLKPKESALPAKAAAPAVEPQDAEKGEGK